MRYEDMIIEKMNKSGGIITNKKLRDYNIPTIYLKRMVDNKKLIRVDRGIYINSSGDYDEYYFFHKRYEVAIFSYVSALFIHNYTDIIPAELEVTVYRGYNAHRFNDNVIVHYVTKSIHNLGVIEAKTIYGNKVKVYNLERTICDFIKNRDEIEPELFVKTINKYVKDKNKNLNKLYTYSKKMKIYEKVKEIIELVYE